MKKLLFAACFLLLLLNGVRVESRAVADAESRRRRPPSDDDNDWRYMLFVFGDSFADNGNHPSDADLQWDSREWRYPYGVSDSAHDRKPTGRFSNGMVQSDFLAMILGHDESPPPYMHKEWAAGIDSSGMNFAVGGSGALEVPSKVPKLSAQVDQLRSLIKDGSVDRRDLRDSVALVAYSGNDYGRASDGDIFDALLRKVIDEMASVVSQLKELGVGKVLLNTLPPFGCSPWLARASNYSSCDDLGNVGSDKHNAALADRLGGEKGVMLLDVGTIFTELVAPRNGSALARKFTQRLRPCCEAMDADGYCGLDDRYSLCERPEHYFYWDDVHPTQAGWRAVMQLLQGPVMAFLGISDLNHF